MNDGESLNWSSVPLAALWRIVQKWLADKAVVAKQRNGYPMMREEERAVG